MEERVCNKCGIKKSIIDFYTLVTGEKRYIEVVCKPCRLIRAAEKKAQRDSKHKECKNCGVQFSNTWSRPPKHFSKGLCKPCWTLEKENAPCTGCGVEFRGNKLPVGKGMCRPCYDKWRKSSLHFQCIECGTSIKSGSIKGICSTCKAFKREELKRSILEYEVSGASGTERKLPKIDEGILQRIRMILVRFKWGYVNTSHYYEVADVFDIVYGYVQQLDTKPVDAQIIIMVKRLKEVYDFNK